MKNYPRLSRSDRDKENAAPTVANGVQRLRLSSFGEPLHASLASDTNSIGNTPTTPGELNSTPPGLSPAPSSPPPPLMPSSNTEWSAVGPAMTGKSGRVIHGLQEDIARLTRECTLHRMRAEEAARSADTLKLQLQSVTDRLANSEVWLEANTQSLARKDRKIADLKAEAASERGRRAAADAAADRTAQLAAADREKHARSIAEAGDRANCATAQYNVLSRSISRDRRDTTARLARFRRDLDDLVARDAERQRQLVRLDVVMEQKDRELVAERARADRAIYLFEEYRAARDADQADVLARTRARGSEFDDVLSEAQEAIGRMRWVVRVKEDVKGAG